MTRLLLWGVHGWKEKMSNSLLHPFISLLISLVVHIKYLSGNMIIIIIIIPIGLLYWPGQLLLSMVWCDAFVLFISRKPAESKNISIYSSSSCVSLCSFFADRYISLWEFVWCCLAISKCVDVFDHDEAVMRAIAGHYFFIRVHR